MEGFLAGRIVVHNLAVAVDLVFVGHQSFQSYRTPGMDLAGTDTDLGTETVQERMIVGKRFHVHVSHIATSPGANAYAVMPIQLS